VNASFLKPTPRFLTKSAAAAIMLYALGHSRSYPWTPVIGPSQQELLRQLQNNTFAVSGVHRSYWDFYVGFGIDISIVHFTIALTLWLLADVLEISPKKMAMILGLFSLSYLAGSVVMWRYLFLPPFVLSSLIVLLTLAAAVKLRWSAKT
jgi:hypothetical protein